MPLESVALLGAVDREPNIASSKSQPEEDKLEEEPGPATALSRRIRLGLILVSLLAALLVARRVRRVLLVQVVRFDGDDVVVV